MELVTARLILREFRASDYAAARAYQGNPAMYVFEKGPLSKADSRAFLENADNQARAIPRTHYAIAVTTRAEAALIGNVHLELLHTDIREWEIGWVIRSDCWGQGYATEAARALLHYAFTTLDAHRVVAFCHASNAPSVRVMEKLGMQRDGLLRETRRWNGQWSDEYVYAILEREWPLERHS